MQTVGFRCPVGFINYPPYLSGSTEILTPTATRSGSEGRRKPALGAERDSMSDSETQRQECDEQYDYREATRFLCSEIIHREQEDATTLLSSLGYDLSRDRYISQEQIRETTMALSRAIEAVQVVAEAQPSTDPVDGFRPSRFGQGKTKAERRDDGGATGE